jgi:MoxR-like ATPase
MDRFMVRLALGYPGPSDEVSLLQRKQGITMLDLVEPVITSDELEEMRTEVDKIHIDNALLNYIVKLVGLTREHPDLILGASPRASIAVASISKAAAYLQGRDYVIPGDITPLFPDTLAHRLVLRPGAENENVSAVKILNTIFKSVPAPQILSP